MTNNTHWNTIYGRYRSELITDLLTDTVFFSDLLPERCPELYRSITLTLKDNNIEHRLLAGTKDIWCRDYMPIQTAEKRFVFYKYNPDYLQPKHLLRTITDVNSVANINRLRQDGEAVELDLVLDGGNVVKCSDKIVMTEKVFFENKDKPRNRIRQMLEDTFQSEIIFLPWDRNEFLGHSDGIVHYIGNNRVLMTNYADFAPTLARRYTRILENFVEVIPLTYNVKRKHKRSWAYVNFLKVGRLVLVPQLGIPEDEQALRQISDAMPASKVIGVPALEAVRKGGALNCISWNVATSRFCDGFMGEEYKENGLSVTQIRQTAEDGQPAYQNDLGVLYFYGQGVQKDIIEANRWYTIAAENGSRMAQFNIGLSYYKGEGVPQYYEKAIYWFKKAAEQGDADAQLHIAWCMEDAKAPLESINAAYLKAAEMGNSDAQCTLGYWILNGKNGWKEDKDEADKWFLKAAKNGNSEGQFQVGVKYRYGRGVKENPKEAAKWFMRAASKNNTWAIFELGLCYYHGAGLRMDNRAAWRRFKRASEKGDPWAKYMFGKCYYFGYGVTEDKFEAVKWYKQAAEEDVFPAAYELGYCLFHGYGTPEDKEAALKMIRKAAEKEYPDALCLLGDYYNEGIVVKKDEDEAINIYQKAVDLGCDEAKEKLRKILEERKLRPIIETSFDDVPY